MNQLRNRLLSILTAAALTIGLSAPALAATPTEAVLPAFQDLAGFGWAEEAIRYLADEGIVVGDGTGLFHPADNVKRADFVMILIVAFDLEIYTRDSFVDVKQDAYYYKYISTAKERGVLRETRDNKFFPEEAITRQDAAVFLYRALQAKRIPVTNGAELSAFSDVNDLDRGAAASMQSLVGAGIISGSGGKLRPTAPMSRAEMACVLYRSKTELHEFWV